MAGKFSLDGSMIPRAESRRHDERGEARIDTQSQTAVLEFRGRKHVVRLVNLSASGAMVIFSLIPIIGEAISMKLIGRGQMTGRVCWVRDGRIGVSFVGPLE
jgi:hypothetical protein